MGMLIDLQPSAGPALVVGGGAIALRKVRNLVDGGFAAVVVAPTVLHEFHALQSIAIDVRPFADSDITGPIAWSMVFACTDDRDVNQRIGELARGRNIPVVVADAQGESTFFTPAILRDGAAAVAISTGGADPALAAALRRRLEAALGPEWGSGIEDARTARAERRAAAE